MVILWKGLKKQKQCVFMLRKSNVQIMLALQVLDILPKMLMMNLMYTQKEA